MRIAPIVAASALFLSGCATASPEAIAANDPFEPTNRAVYRFDEKFDKYVVLPIAGVYFYYLPPPIRHGLHNVLINLDLPVTFANDVMQGEMTRAGTALGRFALNSTVGLGGIVDVATQAGLKYHPADFGQTLGKFGMPEGPFLVLPIIGPEPPRDLLGDAVDLAMEPLLYLPPAAPFYERLSVDVGSRAGAPFEDHARGIVLRRELERQSVDPYATMRSTYRQLRDEQINEGLPLQNEFAGGKNEASDTAALLFAPDSTEGSSK